MKLTVIIPTIGRPALVNCLQSIQNQKLIDGDEILVISDGLEYYVEANEMFKKSSLPGRCVAIDGPNKDWGHTPRNLFMKQATGDFLLHFDDDDVYLDGAFEEIRSRLMMTPSYPHIFRLQLANTVFWRDRNIAYTNVSTQLIVHPNDGKFGTWQPYYGGDFDFIKETCGMYDKVIWDDLIICKKSLPVGQKQYAYRERQLHL